MTDKKNPFEDADRLLLPLWHRADQFEEFFLLWNGMFHWNDYIDNPWEHWTDTFYAYEIKWEDIIVQCIFYQTYSREEDEEEKTETCYIAMDQVFAKGFNWDDPADYKEGKLTKDQKKRQSELKRLSLPHLIEEDKEDRTPQAIAKIKSFLFYQTLWKEKAEQLIENEIKKLWDKISEEDLAELNEIKDTWTIKRSKHYAMLYCLKNMREIAKESGNPHLKQLEEHIKILEDDEKNNS